MRPLLSVGVAIIGFSLCHIGIARNEISARLVPNEVRPGDLVRLEVTRSSEDFAEFQLEVPFVDRLHLIAKEMSPVEYIDGHYTQTESWIFQTDSSGEIQIAEVRVRLLSRDGEKEVQLSPMAISVLPYNDTDPDPEPLDWNAAKSEDSSFLKTLVLLLAIPLAAALYAVLNYRRKRKIKPIEDASNLLADVLSELDKGCLNPNPLYTLYAGSKKDLSPELSLKIEQAIFANRGNSTELATAIRKELQP